MSGQVERGLHPSTELILAAAARRREARAGLRTDAYRLLNGPADGAPAGLTLDAYGRWLVLAARSAVPVEAVRAWGRAAERALEPDGVVMKTLAEDPRESRSEVLGSRRPPLLMVREGDAVFEVRLDDGVHTGLFLDHRETRTRARLHASDVEVLNLFAYTCSFSVQAALAGASRVTSVDVSQRALAWGRRNMSHSGIDPNRHRWFADDVLDHLKRPRRSYGLVILDPPVFGHGRRPFTLLRDLDLLLDGALEQLSDGGVLIASSHHLDVSASRLVRAAETTARARGADVEVLEKLGLPSWDHPVSGPPDPLDRGAYLDTILLRLHRN